MRNLVPIKVGRVTSNDEWPLIYIPAEAIRKLGLRKGARIIMLIDAEQKRLIIQKLEV